MSSTVNFESIIRSRGGCLYCQSMVHICKKSWNVYNADNIERVRRDEADARAHEADEEREQRSQDGDFRLAQLRGVDVVHVQPAISSSTQPADQDQSHSRKKRKLGGEDDTGRDIRLAKSHVNVERPSNETSITDSRGNINLVQPKSTDASRQKPRIENQGDELGLKLADAAGRGSQAGKTWYNTASADDHVQDDVGRDVWGNEDPGRKERERKRVDINDPLAAMKKGVKQLRQAEASRKEWKEQRERDLTEVEQLARQERKRHRRRDVDGDSDSLDGFNLDAGNVEHRDRDGKGRFHHREGHHHSHHRHSHRHRSRSRSPHRRKERRRRSRDAPASITR